VTDEAMRAWAALLRVHARLVPALDRELQRAHGIPLTWYDVLLELNNAPNRRLTMGELGELAVVTRTRATRVIDELVSAGLAAREPNPNDARSTYARITREGRDLLRKAAPTYLAGIDSRFGKHMTRAEARSVASVFERILAKEY